VSGAVRRFGLAATLVLALAASVPQPAAATFHKMLIREVYPGSLAQPGAEYVELQMWAAGQNLVGGHSIDLYGAGGAPLGSATFAADVAGAANQSTLLAATPAAEADFGVSADVGLPPGLLDPAGGAVCWETLDCVAWGDFSGTPSSPVGQPASPAGIPDGMALRRTIAPGCPTLLEPGDDRDDSATDFSLAFPAPRPNSVPPSEHPCEAGSGPGQSGGPSQQATARAPQTRLGRRPPGRSRDRTPTFSFAADEEGAGFECTLDSGRYRRCRSPFTSRRLRPGRHVFRVRARDASGRVDPSPAICRFAIVGSVRSYAAGLPR
jgi:hypothetical protein